MVLVIGVVGGIGEVLVWLLVVVGCIVVVIDCEVLCVLDIWVMLFVFDVIDSVVVDVLVD